MPLARTGQNDLVDAEHQTAWAPMTRPHERAGPVPFRRANRDQLRFGFVAAVFIVTAPPGELSQPRKLSC